MQQKNMRMNECNMFFQQTFKLTRNMAEQEFDENICKKKLVNMFIAVHFNCNNTFECI